MESASATRPPQAPSERSYKSPAGMPIAATRKRQGRRIGHKYCTASRAEPFCPVPWLSRM
eukprot:3347139-Prymnesium_polylepis.1